MGFTPTDRLGLNKVDDDTQDWGGTIRAGYDSADLNIVRDSEESAIQLTSLPVGGPPYYSQPYSGFITGTHTATHHINAGGNYTGSTDTAFVITISNSAGTKFTFIQNGAEPSDAIEILTETAQLLANGTTVTFSTNTGWTEGLSFTFNSYSLKRTDPNVLDPGISFVEDAYENPNTADVPIPLNVKYIGQRYFALETDTWWTGVNTSTNDWKIGRTLGYGTESERNVQVPVPPNGALWANTDRKIIQSGVNGVWVGIAPLDATQGFFGTLTGDVSLNLGDSVSVGTAAASQIKLSHEVIDQGSVGNTAVITVVDHTVNELDYGTDITWETGDGPVRVSNPGTLFPSAVGLDIYDDFFITRIGTTNSIALHLTKHSAINDTTRVDFDAVVNPAVPQLTITRAAVSVVSSGESSEDVDGGRIEISEADQALFFRKVDKPEIGQRVNLSARYGAKALTTPLNDVDDSVGDPFNAGGEAFFFIFDAFNSLQVPALIGGWSEDGSAADLQWISTRNTSWSFAPGNANMGSQIGPTAVPLAKKTIGLWTDRVLVRDYTSVLAATTNLSDDAANRSLFGIEAGEGVPYCMFDLSSMFKKMWFASCLLDTSWGQDAGNIDVGAFIDASMNPVDDAAYSSSAFFEKTILQIVNVTAGVSDTSSHEVRVLVIGEVTDELAAASE